MSDSTRESNKGRSPSGLAQAVVGAWRLESTIQRLADGSLRPSPLYGENGIGYLVYSASGIVCAMLADPRRASWVNLEAPTVHEIKAIHEHFVAYCGRYEVNEQAKQIVHHLEMHITPNCVGSALVRSVSIDGDRLILRPLPKELKPGVLEYTLTWVRA